MYNRLQELRWEKDWSQTQLAMKSNVSHSTISLIENNPLENPHVYTAIKLAHALGVSVEDIFKFWEWRKYVIKNISVDVIGIKVTKNAEGKFDHKVVSETKFTSYEEAGKSIDSHNVKGLVFVGIPTYNWVLRMWIFN